MLVIISDLHLSDGTSGSTISPGAFQLLGERLVDLAAGASQRRDGDYRPVERVDLVLLGDVLDVIRSSKWLEGRVRPWDDVASPQLHDTVSRVAGDVLRQNSEACGEFRKLAQQGLAIPAATRDGRPAVRELHNVPVRIHYMVGNHDWFFHLPGPNYNQLRRQVTEQLGLATSPDAPFPHEAWEDNELLQTLRRHKVFARHGDVYDPFNYEGDRNASSLGDVVVIELLNRFSVQVTRELAEDLPPSALAGLREIDNIRPLLLIPVWIDGLLERSCPQPSVRKQVKKVWDALADEFLENPFVRTRDTWRPVDIVDGLQKALKFSRRLSVGWASWVAQWMWQLRGADNSSYYQHALSEQDFRNRRAKHIVYGHTHNAEVVPLDASFAEGYVLHQAYFNCGTWRRVYEQTRFASTEHEFIAADTLTYLAFFKDDERRGRPYETWSGTLGVAPHAGASLRLDSKARAMPRGNRFQHQAYRSERPTSPYRLLPSGPPSAPSSPEFDARMAAVGATVGRANVAAVYLIHGTFSGNDALGLLTELGRFAPGLSESLRKLTKGATDLVLGETGNYSVNFAARMEASLSAGAGRSIPVRRFNWSGQNTHIARADGAVRLIDELATLATQTQLPAGGDTPPRVILWGHSHGGNVLSLLSNLLGGDATSRGEFFQAARPFYRRLRSARIDFPAWQRVEDLLAADAHPLRRVQIDMVTFGTPIRYGWETAGYGNLLHFVYHRPHHVEHHWRARFPPRLASVLAALEGDFIQHLGIAGSGFPGNPLAFRTFNANRRLRQLVAGDTRGWLLTRMKAGARVPDEGKTLLVDYADPAWFPLRHIFGHALYTRSRWLPLQCELMAEEFYAHVRPGL